MCLVRFPCVGFMSMGKGERLRDHSINGMSGMLSGISKVSTRLHRKLNSLQTKMLEQVDGLSTQERLKMYQALSDVYSNHLIQMGGLVHHIKHQVKEKEDE